MSGISWPAHWTHFRSMSVAESLDEQIVLVMWAYRQSLRVETSDHVREALQLTEALSLHLLGIAGEALRCATALLQPAMAGKLLPGARACSGAPPGAGAPAAGAAGVGAALARLRELAGLEQACCRDGARCCAASPEAWPPVADLMLGHCRRAEELLQDVAPLQQREVEGGFELQLNLKKLQLKAKRLGEANVLLASQLSWTGLFLPTRPPPPAAFEVRFCCAFRHWVEGIAGEAFLSLGRPLRLVELGVQAGELAEHLLSRYDWIHWTGVDLMIDADGNKYGFGQNRSLDLAAARAKLQHFGPLPRVRVLMPMSTSRAARLLRREGARVDLLVLDARLSFEGLAEDVRAWLPLLAPGARLVGRWGAAVVAEFMRSERRLHRLRLGSQQDGAQWTVDVS
ncbi:unnamed protein product [Prorocentrum cordatum]|uniref:Uncharacterized protein n=1 Tax=Prorocentrum cordatum TaxID=2364126 RepID=A0ABN9TEE5_9DINO|nr:unnamed protein product [Polarella glacialis]